MIRPGSTTFVFHPNVRPPLTIAVVIMLSGSGDSEMISWFVRFRNGTGTEHATISVMSAISQSCLEKFTLFISIPLQRNRLIIELQRGPALHCATGITDNLSLDNSAPLPDAGVCTWGLHLCPCIFGSCQNDLRQPASCPFSYQWP